MPEHDFESIQMGPRQDEEIQRFRNSRVSTRDRLHNLAGLSDMYKVDRATATQSGLGRMRSAQFIIFTVISMLRLCIG